GFRAKHANYYRDYVDLLLAQGRSEQAFEVLERSRARTLLEMLAEGHIDIHEGADAGLRQQERDLQAEIAAKSNRRLRLLGEKHTEDQVAAIDQEIKKQVSEYQDVEEQLRSSSPVYAALT